MSTSKCYCHHREVKVSKMKKRRLHSSFPSHLVLAFIPPSSLWWRPQQPTKSRIKGFTPINKRGRPPTYLVSNVFVYLPPPCFFFLRISGRDCWRKMCTSAKHTASRTSWLHTRRESRDVPVNFPWKLTKDKVVKYQSLELAGWYQTFPYLRLRSQMGWHIATESYLPINWNHSGALRRKSNIAEWMTQAWPQSVSI
jgi:hypothetical protein